MKQQNRFNCSFHAWSCQSWLHTTTHTHTHTPCPARTSSHWWETADGAEENYYPIQQFFPQFHWVFSVTWDHFSSGVINKFQLDLKQDYMSVGDNRVMIKVWELVQEITSPPRNVGQSRKWKRIPVLTASKAGHKVCTIFTAQPEQNWWDQADTTWDQSDLLVLIGLKLNVKLLNLWVPQNW